MTMRVLVVDDEPLARLGVCARLKRHEDVVIVGECASSDEAAQCIDLEKPDLLFLDVQMPGGSGVQLLRSFPAHQMPCAIFLTAHAEYAVDAFGVEALDYLLKPIDDGRFAAALDRARRLFQLHRQQCMSDESSNPPSLPPGPSNHGYLQRFPVRRGGEISLVLASAVDWIEGLGDYAGLHVGKRVHLVRESLSSLSCRLDPQMFHRIHRSAIVQIDRIRHIKTLRNRDLTITLQDGTNLRTSRTYSGSLQSLIQC
jgi:two-component system LytT family response regulator